MMKKHILLNFVKSVTYFCMNFVPFNSRGQGTINQLNVGHIEFKMADTKTEELHTLDINIALSISQRLIEVET